MINTEQRQITLVKIVMNNKLLIAFILIYNITFSQKKDTTSVSFSTIPAEIILKERELMENAKKEKTVQPFLNCDTLYIFIRNKNTDIYYAPKNYLYNDVKIRDTTITYRFYLKDSTYIDFFHRKYFGWDELESNTKSIIRKEKKVFLRKNKKQIMSNKFFEVNKIKNVNYFLRMLKIIIDNKKNIYLIDENEIHNGVVTLRQVKFNPASHVFFTEKI